MVWLYFSWMGLLQFIVKDMIPFSTVDGVRFVEFMNKASQNYEVPSWFTIKKLSQRLYQTEKY